MIEYHILRPGHLPQTFKSGTEAAKRARELLELGEYARVTVTKEKTARRAFSL